MRNNGNTNRFVIQGKTRLGAYRLRNTLVNLNYRRGHVNITRLEIWDVLDIRIYHVTKNYSFNTPVEVLMPNKTTITTRKPSAH